ncbi:4-hydroxy-tetrahydrodipicolinate synthase [Rhodococcus sp. NPDC058521]|uniref:4-hydroxy-tetrahydrodipicolinate synthase n=1 Tax=Rhodococcus sp. NPDC058521 TaxID=3346536 RepID=UPI003648A450
MSLRPSGIFVPLVTPFTDGGDIAESVLERLAHTAIEEGAAGIVALGTTAEASTLSPAEKRTVITTCWRVCREHDVPLIVGVGTNDTAETVHSIREVHENADAAGVLVVVPYYTRPSEAGVVAHFQHIADHSPLPVVLYNVPYRTAQSLGQDSLIRLAAHPRIVGVKQAVGSVDTDTALLLARTPNSFSVLAGEDTLVSPLLAMGASGGILAAANVCAAELVELHRLWRSGRTEEARGLGNRLVAPVAGLLGGPNPTVVKAVLHAQGRIPNAFVRLPLLRADAPTAVVQALNNLRAG